MPEPISVDVPTRAHRRRTTMAGVFVLLGMLAGALSIVPVLERPEYLTRQSTHEREILAGAGFQLLMIPAYVGFALCRYPTRTPACSLSVPSNASAFAASTASSEARTESTRLTVS